MSIIYINEKHDRLKDYSAVVKGAKGVVTIRIECNEPGSLGFLLEELGNIERAQKLAAQRAKEEAAAAKRKKPLALPAPPLQLPYFGEGGDA